MGVSSILCESSGLDVRVFRISALWLGHSVDNSCAGCNTSFPFEWGSDPNNCNGHG